MINESVIKLKQETAEYANFIIGMLKTASDGVFKRDDVLLKKVLKIQESISDERNLRLLEECVNSIAKFAPVAKNLRIIISIIRISANLERIGDHCVNIAESGGILNSHIQVKSYIDLPKMKDLTSAMLEKSINALINQDIDLAREVLTLDEEVDDYKAKINSELEDYMADKDKIHLILELINIVNNLERIADLSVNICGEAIYMESGRMG
jgi:phosphate transport system protein